MWGICDAQVDSLNVLLDKAVRVRYLKIIMGQKSSHDEHADKISEINEFFSAKERDILKQYCTDSKDQIDKNKLKLSKRLPKRMFDGISRFLAKENESSKHGIDVWFPEVVVKLTKGSIEQLGYATFIIFGCQSDQFSLENLQNDLTDLFMHLYGEQDSKNLFKVVEKDCRIFITKLFADFPSIPTPQKLTEYLYKHSLLVDILQFRFYTCFFDCMPEISNNAKGSVPVLLPTLSNTKLGFEIPLATAVFLNSKLPLECQYEWRFLFSSKLNGESFTKLCTSITDQGPLILYVVDTDGQKFGGFISVSCVHSAQFQGDRRSFLFTAEPELETYSPTGYNDHYMYLNIGQETLPNGLGMGGQHNFFGLWLDSEFGGGHSKAKPTCTTYNSPQLSKQDVFKIQTLEVWGVGEKPKKEEGEEDVSVLNKHVEAKALLEIIGKERVSEGLREADPEADIPEEKELYHSHDPMQ